MALLYLLVHMCRALLIGNVIQYHPACMPFEICLASLNNHVGSFVLAPHDTTKGFTEDGDKWRPKGINSLKTLMAGIQIGTPNRKTTNAVLVESNPINRNRSGNGDWRGNEHTMIDRCREITREMVKEIVYKPETMLIVRIYTAEEIDRETKDPRGDRRIYQVHGWVIPETGFFTQRSGSLPNPEWYQEYAIPSGLFNSGNSLHLELYRIKSKSDPGPSTGIVLVGRVQIKLPEKLNHEECGRHLLVKPGGSADGVLHIKFTLMTKEDFDVDYE